MRGRPILQWLLFLTAWAAFAVPVALLLPGRGHADSPNKAEEQQLNTWITLRFSSQPTTFHLAQNGTTLWREGPATGLEHETTAALVLDEFGAELLLQAALPTGTSAVEVVLEPDGMAPRSQTLWTDGDLDEILTFTWGAP